MVANIKVSGSMANKKEPECISYRTRKSSMESGKMVDVRGG
jgi:hypothetical protein